MIVGLILFVLGASFGGCAVVVNQRMVDLQTDKLRRKNEKLLEKIHRDRIVYERSNAYRKGYRDGLEFAEGGKKKE